MSKSGVKPEGASAEGDRARNKYLDPDYKGEPLDDKLADGPAINRGCTDLLCCLLFTSFIIAWFAIGFYGFANGDPLLLTYPFDSNGYQCGKPHGMAEDYEYVYYPYPLPSSNLTDFRACVKDCPKSKSATIDCFLASTDTPLGKDCEFKANNMEILETTQTYLNTFMKKGKYKTKGYLSRFCLPDKDLDGELKDAYDDIVDALKIDVIQEWLSDVFLTWEVMFIVAGAALAFSFVYMVFIRFCVGVIVWVSIIFTIAFIAVLGAFFHWAALNLYDEDSDPKTVRNLKILAYVMYALSGLVLIYIFYMCNKIRLAIAIMKVGTQYIKDVWMSLLIPPCFFILIIALYIYWSLACLYLYSSGEVESSSGSSPFASVSWSSTEKNAFYFEFWGILWTNAFLIALGQFVLASSVCIWYFSVNSDSGPQRPISRSFYRAFRYHLGSLAFGSLILAIVWTIKYLLMYFQEYIKKTGAGQNSRVVQWFLRVLTCYVLCFERFIKFLNKNAYIQIALQGSSFCGAARDAFFLILRNASRFLAVGSIGGVFMFLGKWVVTLGSTYVGYMIITRQSYWADKIHSPIFPTVVYVLIAYTISGLFMSVYGMACDTILQCFLADEELSAKNRGAPSHSPEILSEFMGKERQKDQSARCCDCC